MSHLSEEELEALLAAAGWPWEVKQINGKWRYHYAVNGMSFGYGDPPGSTADTRREALQQAWDMVTEIDKRSVKHDGERN